jgi:hypothetical protein
VRNGITGLLVDPADIQTLARALVRLLSDDGERNRLGTAGRQWCEATFSLDRYRREIRGVVDATILGTTPPIVADPAGAATPAATTPALLAGANR